LHSSEAAITGELDVRIVVPLFRRLRDGLQRHDAFEILFELFIVVLGVMLGIAASNWSQSRQDREYRQQMILALDQALTDYVDSGHHIHNEIVHSFNDYKKRVAGGEHPPPPILRFPLLDRPPTRAWDAVVATGLARSISPKLVFQLAMHFSNADSFGDRYQRYNQFTEGQILPYESSPAHFYDGDGKLRMPYTQHVQRLRELLNLNDEMTNEAVTLRAELDEER
jgi:hypothetical protein